MISQVEHILAFAEDVLGNRSRFRFASAVLQAISAERDAIRSRWPLTKTEEGDLNKLLFAENRIRELVMVHGADVTSKKGGAVMTKKGRRKFDLGTCDGKSWSVVRHVDERTVSLTLFRDEQEVGFWTFTAGGFASPTDSTNKPHEQRTDYENWPDDIMHAWEKSKVFSALVVR
jgi:hypothetical protein